MSFIINEWIDNKTDPTITTLRMTGVYTADVIVPTEYVEKLRPYSWCYEQGKGQVYATDFTMELPKLLGVTCPRIYLWKYIILLHTGKIAKSWKRKDLTDYRPNHGSVTWASEEVLV